MEKDPEPKDLLHELVEKCVYYDGEDTIEAMKHALLQHEAMIQEFRAHYSETSLRELRKMVQSRRLYSMKNYPYDLHKSKNRQDYIDVLVELDIEKYRTERWKERRTIEDTIQEKRTIELKKQKAERDALLKGRMKAIEELKAKPNKTSDEYEELILLIENKFK